MDFFAHQDQAQQKSRVFFIGFFGAVFLAVFILYFVLTVCIGVFYFTFAHMQNGPWPLPAFIYGSPNRILALAPFLKIAPLLSIVIISISLVRRAAIKNGGGAYIAEMLGGVEVRDPVDRKQKEFLNVVTEMSVASGLPRPRLYVLDSEFAINAVTAGLNREDTIVAVTQGALDHFDRAELQAVVAHEFAHIANGDYALSLTMAGWLYGLLFFSARGKDLLRLAGEIGGRAAVTPIIIGTVLWIGGWAGKLSAQLLEAAFSRQREYLADAFAVQFTRNPAALAGALKKIAGLKIHGALKNGQSMALNSFFIVSPAKVAGLLRTHPPLAERIARLEPGWDGQLPVIHLSSALRQGLAAEPVAQMPPAALPSDAVRPWLDPSSQAILPALPISQTVWNTALAALAGGGLASVRDEDSLEKKTAQVASSGALNAYQKRLALDSLQEMRGFLEAMPGELKLAISDSAQAPDLLLALLLKEDERSLARQLGQIAHFLDEATARRAAGLKNYISEPVRLPLLSLVAPQLAGLRPEGRRVLGKALAVLIGESGAGDMFVVAALRLLKKYLGFRLPGEAEPSGPASVEEDVLAVLAFTAVAGCADSGLARQAMAAGLAHFADWPPLPPDLSRAADTDGLAAALDRLIRAPEDLRRRLLLAVASVVSYDKIITEHEFDILKSLAASVEMPLPYLSEAVPPREA